MRKGWIGIAIAASMLASGCQAQEKEAKAQPATEAASVDYVNDQVSKTSDRVTATQGKADKLEKEISEISKQLGGNSKPTPNPPPTPTPGSVSFKDVKSTYWAYEPIMKLNELNIITGYIKEKRFYPERTITRAQAASMLTKALKLPLSDKPSQFKDVKASYWAAKQITTVSELGLISGNSGRFQPNAPMKRRDMAIALQRGFHLQVLNKPYTEYKDVQKSDPAYEAIKAISQNHIAGGSNGKFMPNNPTKRSQFAAFMYKAMQKQGLLQ